MKAQLKGTTLLRDAYCSSMDLVAGGFVIWAGLLLTAQCFFWFRTGVWQPAPAMTLFLAPAAQAFHVRVIDGPGLSPLSMVPSWASFESPDAVVIGLAGNLLGFAKVLHWLLDTSLSLWLFSLAFLCGGTGAAVANAYPGRSAIAQDVPAD